MTLNECLHRLRPHPTNASHQHFHDGHVALAHRVQTHIVCRQCTVTTNQHPIAGLHNLLSELLHQLLVGDLLNLVMKMTLSVLNSSSTWWHRLSTTSSLPGIHLTPALNKERKSKQERYMAHGITMVIELTLMPMKCLSIQQISSMCRKDLEIDSRN